MKNPFFGNIFNSGHGFDHYFIGPKNDRFILSSLEKLDFDEYLYRLLRECGYERVVFADLATYEDKKLAYRIKTYDRFSYLSYMEPGLFEKVPDGDREALDEFLRTAEKRLAGEGGGANTSIAIRTEKKAPATPRSEMGKFVSPVMVDATYVTQFTGKIPSALNSKKSKTAIVLPVEMFQTAAAARERSREILNGIADVRREVNPNILLFTAETGESLRDLCSIADRLPALSAGFDKWEEQAGERLVKAHWIGLDEIANLLLRKKIVEGAPGFDKLAFSMAEPLAEKIHEHFTRAANKNDSAENLPFYAVLPNTLSREQFIGRLNEALDKEGTFSKILTRAETLKLRARPHTRVERNGLELERMGGKYVPASRIPYEEAMRGLNGLIGLEKVKTALKTSFNRARYGDGEKNGPGHYAFVGNPGTGKTEVARLMGPAFRAAGLLKSGHLVEVKREDLITSLVGESGKKTKAKCEEALDGVLFFDEAHSLISDENAGSPYTDQAAKEAYEALMTFMENNRQRVCVIFAGYKDRINKFLDADPGMRSRVSPGNVIDFQDYTADELFAILETMLKAGEYTSDDGYREAAKRALHTMHARKDGEFGNAREVRNFLEASKGVLANRMGALGERGVREEEIERQRRVLTAEDVPEDYKPAKPLTGYADALGGLDGLIGLENVKRVLKQSFNKTLTYGKKSGPGHYAFCGSPGTGKTEVARRMGDIFKKIGLLKSGHVVEVKREDLITSLVGESGKKTKAKCEEALDGVLFFDEAYSLISDENAGSSYTDPAAKEAYEALMTFMENNRHRACVICAGYRDKMTKFLDANSGMRSRVSPENIIDFPDYSANELFAILESMLRADDFMPDESYIEAAKRAMEIMYARKDDEFGNARDVRNFLESSRNAISDRMGALRESGAGEEEIDKRKFILTAEDIPRDYRPKEIAEEYETARRELDRLIGLASVKDKVTTLVNTRKFSETSEDPGHYAFCGSPGTGKTEVARLFGKLLHTAGLLTKGHVVEVKRENLVGGYEGQSAIKTKAKCDEARGGVLFVDEAYGLMPTGHGVDYGKEALDTIMTFMENKRRNACVIFAGYEHEMEELIASNPGIKSRIGGANIIRFEDYSVAELMDILRLMIGDKGKTADDAYFGAAERIFRHWTTHKTTGYGNARDVRGLVQNSVARAANRLAAQYARLDDVPEPERNLLAQKDLEADYLRKLFPGGEAEPKPFEPLRAAELEALAARKQVTPYDADDPEAFHAGARDALLYIRTDRDKGTGFLISPDGLALTCAHVTEGASEITARVRVEGRQGGRDSEHVCEVLHAIPGLDLALLRLRGENFPYMKLAPADRKIVRDEGFLLIGYPFGKDADYTSYSGSVASSEDRRDEHGPLRFIEGEAKVGNSGSPLLSKRDGTVIGVLLGSDTNRSGNLVEEMNKMRPIGCFWENFTNYAKIREDTK
jgi:AAA+ superfamily predicted ATPase